MESPEGTHLVNEFKNSIKICIRFVQGYEKSYDGGSSRCRSERHVI